MLLGSLVIGFAPAGRPRHVSPRRASPTCNEAADDEWRAVRARLVQGERQEGGEAQASFAFESPLIEVGTLLLDTEMQRHMTARPAEQAFFHKAVVLLVEHSVGGGTAADARGDGAVSPSADVPDDWWRHTQPQRPAQPNSLLAQFVSGAPLDDAGGGARSGWKEGL